MFVQEATLFKCFIHISFSLRSTVCDFVLLSINSFLFYPVIFSMCSIICLNHHKIVASDASAVEVKWFICHMELTRKMRGGGRLVYRCPSVGEIPQPSFRGQSIPPQACVSEALQHLADHIKEMKQKRLDLLLVILEDFKRANLSSRQTAF